MKKLTPKFKTWLRLKLRRFLQVDSDANTVAELAKLMDRNHGKTEDKLKLLEISLGNAHKYNAATLSQLNELQGTFERIHEVAIDLGINEQSLIVVLSRLDGGRCTIIPAYFKDVLDLQRKVAEVEKHYGTANLERPYIVDAPRGFPKETLGKKFRRPS